MRRARSPAPLEDAGIVGRRLYSERPPRYEYLLTPGAEPVIFEHDCGAEFHARTVCAACGEPVGEGDLRVCGGTHPVEATL